MGVESPWVLGGGRMPGHGWTRGRAARTANPIDGVAPWERHPFSLDGGGRKGSEGSFCRLRWVGGMPEVRRGGLTVGQRDEETHLVAGGTETSTCSCCKLQLDVLVGFNLMALPTSCRSGEGGDRREVWDGDLPNLEQAAWRLIIAGIWTSARDAYARDQLRRSMEEDLRDRVWAFQGRDALEGSMAVPGRDGALVLAILPAGGGKKTRTSFSCKKKGHWARDGPSRKAGADMP